MRKLFILIPSLTFMFSIQFAWGSKYQFIEAVKQGDIKAVKLYIRSGKSVNVKGMTTPLHWASVHGHVDVFDALIEAGAKVNARNNVRSTPLHNASSFGHGVIVRKLLENGAKIDAKNRSGSTPLHNAILRDHAHIVRILLMQGANPNAIDEYGETSLDLAKSKEVKKTLKKYGAKKVSLFKRIKRFVSKFFSHLLR